ncbi:MAG: 3-deoxy-manno-octulosonate cytidylyltransferase [Paramuribaculum sp.]|nr:3-deoxy-manno-octulosonate cytidylyltransferase [Paramuribaculum sp.]
MTITAVIPARYDSTRLPGKPLAMIGGIPMIEHVWRRVSAVVPDTLIATDSQEIARVAAGFGANAVLTDPDISTGTLRCFDACAQVGCHSDVIINIQGDEPFISSDTMEAVLGRIAGSDAPDIATAATLYDPSDGYDSLVDPNRVKVVTDCRSRALYFSRAVIPARRDGGIGDYPYLIHHGIYAFRSHIINEIASLGSCALAEVEKLEQLAWLNAGYSIGVTVVDDPPLAIDTPDDLVRANDLVNGKL